MRQLATYVMNVPRWHRKSKSDNMIELVRESIGKFSFSVKEKGYKYQSEARIENDSH